VKSLEFTFPLVRRNLLFMLSPPALIRSAQRRRPTPSDSFYDNPFRIRLIEGERPYRFTSSSNSRFFAYWTFPPLLVRLAGVFLLQVREARARIPPTFLAIPAQVLLEFIPPPTPSVALCASNRRFRAVVLFAATLS